MKKNMIAAFMMMVIILITIVVGCDRASDRREREDVERAQLQLVTNQPPPQFDWSVNP